MTARTPLRRLLIGGVASLAVAVGLSGCSFGGWVYNADLPGGAKLGSHPLTLTADFADVLDLVPQSSVKVDDVAVGRVTKIALRPDGHSARVTLKVNRDADLVTGTTARLEQSSLLGEKYVALVPPGEDGASTGSANVGASTGSANVGRPLSDGAHVPLSSTSAAADVEQVLGSLSLVLNGGGIGQFQEISRELQKVGTGRTAQIRDFLTQIDRFISTMNSRKDAITSALDGLDHLSTALRGDDDKIAHALDGLSPGMKVLAEQRPQLVAMLTSLDKLSDVTVATLDKSQKDMVADLKTLDPILTQLGKAGKSLPDALQILLTYPFPDSVLDAAKGDYLNVFMTTNFRTTPSDCSGIGCAWPQVAGRSVTPSYSGPGALTGLVTSMASASGSPSSSASTSGTPVGTPSASQHAGASGSAAPASGAGASPAWSPPSGSLPPTAPPLAPSGPASGPTGSLAPAASGPADSSASSASSKGSDD